MGRATRWFRHLVGWKKPDKEPRDRDGMEEIRAKKRWSFCNSRMDPSEAMPEKLERTKWMMSMYTEREREQNKHAIAVAATTAAAADAAVAATRAAVEVVRLTRKVSISGFGVSERLAAVKIQRVFRGYLAKKALRALKALMKLQALVRGYLVRKQAVAALHSMEALVRAQATI